MLTELKTVYNILVSFLGEPRRELDENNYELEFSCPRCVEEKGAREAAKHNLAVNLKKQRFHCWSCAQVHEDMQGSIIKLIKLYGNTKILEEYKRAIHALRNSDLYKLNFSDADFNIDTKMAVASEMEAPEDYHPFNKNRYNPPKALQYLFKRGITWDIIEYYNIGYTDFSNKKKELKNRIIIPSYDKNGYLNYWTGRNFDGYKYAQKYYNPKAERKKLIFNEEKIQWNADITLVEGPFDHIVVPNSIPLLGKVLKPDFKLYHELINNAKAHINIFLDGDASSDALKTYKLLNQGKLKGRIRIVPSIENLDPSEIFEKYGYKGIAKCLKEAYKISEFDLLTI